MSQDNTRNFPGGPQDEAIPEFQLPPVISVCNGPAGTKVCPFIPAQILVMPVNAGKSSLLSGQQVQQAFVRQYTPCVKELCIAWKYDQGLDGAPDLETGHCKLVEK